MSLLGETLTLAATDSSQLALAALEHVALVGAALLLALLTGVPAGIVAVRRADALPSDGLLRTLPLSALFGLCLAPLVWLDSAWLAALAVAWLYGHATLSQSVRRTLTAIDPALCEAVRALGLTARQQWQLLDGPLLWPVLLAEVRQMVAVSIGLVALAAFAGTGGLGVWLYAGFIGADTRSLLLGALAVAGLALAVDGLLYWLQRRLTPVGPDEG